MLTREASRVELESLKETLIYKCMVYGATQVKSHRTGQDRAVRTTL
jgi:hypothetical protein